MRATARFILFAISAFVLVVFYVPLGHSDYTGRWGGGTYGAAATRGMRARVTKIEPDSPAQRAGIRVGDRLVVAPFSNEWVHEEFPRAGEVERFMVLRPDGSRFSVTMRAIPVRDFTLWDRITGVLAIVPATIFFAIAFSLVFLRPSVMTWSFYAYAVGYFSTQPSFQYFGHVLPVPAFVALTFVLSTFLSGFAVLPLLPFVLRFPDDKVVGVRQWIDRTVWIVMAFAFVAYAFEWYATWATGSDFGYAAWLDSWLPLSAFVAAALILVKKFRHAPQQIRQRFGFLVIGLIVSFIAYAVYFIPGIPFAVGQIAGYAIVVMPISVAYAVLRHRVLDVNFVLNRAIAYGLVSLFVIVVVSILDWLFSRVVSEAHLAILGELAVTIVIGFFLDRINKWIEGGVESVLFRSRRVAERYLRRAAEALPYATQESAVTDGLVQVPDEALKLTAAAHYRRGVTSQRFEGVGTTRETTMAPAGFDVNHLLVRMLKASEETVWLDELRSHLDADNAAIYVIAIPVSVRHELVSFTLYGAHRNGAQLDPEEVELLRNLAREASRAYDHIEAVHARERYARLIGPSAETLPA